MPKRKLKKKLTNLDKQRVALKNILDDAGDPIAINQHRFEHTQQAEADSWLIEDKAVRNDKASRETARYPLLKKQMGLGVLDTSKMIVFDIGAGPLGGVSTILNCKSAVRIEPLYHEYKKFYPCYNYKDMKAEDLKQQLSTPDLIIITNALDHFDNPGAFMEDLVKYMKPGAYFAHLHAENNAITHKHEAHAHNVNPELFREYLSADFETVWYLDYQNDGLTYGWRKQPAFSGLYRKVTGYNK